MGNGGICLLQEDFMYLIESPKGLPSSLRLGVLRPESGSQAWWDPPEVLTFVLDLHGDHGPTVSRPVGVLPLLPAGSGVRFNRVRVSVPEVFFDMEFGVSL